MNHVPPLYFSLQQSLEFLQTGSHLQTRMKGMGALSSCPLYSEPRSLTNSAGRIQRSLGSTKSSLLLLFLSTTLQISLGAEKQVRSGCHFAKFQLSSPTQTITIQCNPASFVSSLNLSIMLLRKYLAIYPSTS